MNEFIDNLNKEVAAKVGVEYTSEFSPTTDTALAMKLLGNISGAITITRTAANKSGAWGVNVMRREGPQWVWAGRGDADTLEIAICRLIARMAK